MSPATKTHVIRTRRKGKRTGIEENQPRGTEARSRATRSQKTASDKRRAKVNLPENYMKLKETAIAKAKGSLELQAELRKGKAGFYSIMLDNLNKKAHQTMLERILLTERDLVLNYKPDERRIKGNDSILIAANNLKTWGITVPQEMVTKRIVEKCPSFTEALRVAAQRNIFLEDNVFKFYAKAIKAGIGIEPIVLAIEMERAESRLPKGAKKGKSFESMVKNNLSFQLRIWLDRLSTENRVKQSLEPFFNKTN